MHDPKRVRALLVLSLTNLGDGVFLLPTLCAIREVQPKLRVGIVAKPLVCSLLREHVDDVFTFTAPWFPGYGGTHDGCAGTLKLVRGLRRLNYSDAVNTIGDVRSNLVARASGVRRLYVNEERHGDWLATEAIKKKDLDRCHEVERINRLLSRCLGKDLPIRAPSIAVSGPSVAEARALLNEVGIVDHRMAAIHPGANVSFKQWSAEGYVAVARALIRRGLAVAILGFGEREEQIAREVTFAAGPGAFCLANRTPLNLLPAVLSMSAIYIGNDSGPGHIAAAVGTCVVTIFGSGDPVRFRPYLPSERLRIVSPPVVRSISKAFPQESAVEALSSIRYERVLDAAIGLLENRK